MLKKCLIFALAGLCSGLLFSRAFAGTCEFSEKIYDKVKVIREVDNQTKACVMTLAPASTVDGKFQIVSISGNKMSVVTSENYVEAEKIATTPLSGIDSSASLPELQFVSGSQQILLSWQKRWILVSSIDTSVLASNINETKALTNR